MKLKKYGSIENKRERHNTWYTGRCTETNTINGL